MNEKNDVDNKIDDVMMPGFRFHPTDEELVGFYLKKKIQQRSLPIELIKQVDIYKYDPWDLPKLASSGEKEWYFYCPRDRKYRNSARPNRVTGAGFWKATGTDRPIYSSDGIKCIGLKKSLVFYRGRAAKGLKTDWMMHEFRLPTTTTTSESAPPKKLLDKAFPPHDSWAICRIFKKTNSIAQRALSQAWMAPFPEASTDMFPQYHPQFSSEIISCTTESGSSVQLCSNNDHLQQPASTSTFSALNIPSCKPINAMAFKPSFWANPNENLPPNFMFSPQEMSGQANNKCTDDVSSMFFNIPPDLMGSGASKGPEDIEFEGSDHHLTSFSPEIQEGINLEKHQISDNQWGNVEKFGFPFNLASNIGDGWDSPNCNSEISTTYSPDKCYT